MYSLPGGKLFFPLPRPRRTLISVVMALRAHNILGISSNLKISNIFASAYWEKKCAWIIFNTLQWGWKAHSAPPYTQIQQIENAANILHWAKNNKAKQTRDKGRHRSTFFLLLTFGGLDSLSFPTGVYFPCMPVTTQQDQLYSYSWQSCIGGLLIVCFDMFVGFVVVLF